MATLDSAREQYCVVIPEDFPLYSSVNFVRASLRLISRFTLAVWQRHLGGRDSTYSIVNYRKNPPNPLSP